MSLIDSIKENEGFEGNPYTDTEGFLTIGFGTKLPLDRDEAELLLNYRLDENKRVVEAHLKQLHIEDEAWDILYEMAYQMGVLGMMKFKKMIKALEVRDYERASIEMLDSKWAKQTPNRAKRLADRMKDI